MFHFIFADDSFHYCSLYIVNASSTLHICYEYFETTRGSRKSESTLPPPFLSHPHTWAKINIQTYAYTLTCWNQIIYKCILREIYPANLSIILTWSLNRYRGNNWDYYSDFDECDIFSIWLKFCKTQRPIENSCW